MRRPDLRLLVSGVLMFAAACGSSSTPGKDGGGGKDGSAGTSGAAGVTGTAGSPAGTGGAAAGTGGSTAGTGGSTATDGGAGATDAIDAPKDMAASETGDAPIDAPLSTAAMRGQYLVGVLGCSGCHTPQKVGGGGADTTKLLSGVDCFAKDTAGTGCLASANLTNDATGIKNLSDQQVIDAMTKGNFPGGTQFLFSNMPYYQFSNLTTDDATAIVAYLRALPAIAHAALANTGGFATRPTAAQWAPVTLAQLPSAATDGGTDAGAGSTTNGKYFAALVCSTCHTVNTTATAPLQLDATKAFQGGKEFTTSLVVPVDGGADGGDAGADAATTMTISKKIQSANLTPDTTGLKTWTVPQIVTAIRMGKDEGGRTICSPMRPNPSITDQDATDVANYLKAIPAVVNALSETCE